MRKILFYGDSNTYGYDPSDFFGGPYPQEKIWTNILAERIKGSWEIINCGENGRRIPDPASGYRYPARLLLGLGEGDVFAVMLGANDLLITTSPDAEIPISRMDRFLAWLTQQKHHPAIFLIAPPLIGSGKSADACIQKAYQESVRMNEGFEKLADLYGVMFADTSKWGVTYAFDEIHFSGEGHRIFAENMVQFIESQLPPHQSSGEKAQSFILRQR